MRSHLRLDEDEIDEQHDVVVLDVFVRKSFASRTLSQPDAFAEGTIIGRSVRGIELIDGIATFDADGHSSTEGDMFNLEFG